MTQLLHALQFRWQRHIAIYDDELVDLESLERATVVHFAEALRQVVSDVENRLIRRINRRAIQEAALLSQALRVVREHDSTLT